MKIAVFEAEPADRAAFDDLARRHEVVFFREPLTAANAETAKDADVVSVFVYSRLGAAVIARLPDLELVATRSTGIDHVDLAAAAERGIAVANVPTYGEQTVAEHVFALLTAISHNIVDAVNRTRRGDFTQEGLQGFDLEGKTLGLVGTGHIGKRTARIGRGFGMEVIAHDIAPDEDEAARWGYAHVPLEELYRRADVVSLHVPETEATRHMVDDDAFAAMKDGVVVINTARGGVMDVRALLRALASGKVRAAGLDVLPDEPTVREEAELLSRMFRKEHDLETLLADHVLLRLRNVIITPHSGFNTKEAVNRILTTTVDNIAAHERGEARNRVV